MSAGSGKPFWHLRIPKVKCRALEGIFGVDIVGKVWKFRFVGAPWDLTHLQRGPVKCGDCCSLFLGGRLRLREIK